MNQLPRPPGDYRQSQARVRGKKAVDVEDEVTHINSDIRDIETRLGHMSETMATKLEVKNLQIKLLVAGITILLAVIGVLGWIIRIVTYALPAA